MLQVGATPFGASVTALTCTSRRRAAGWCSELRQRLAVNQTLQAGETRIAMERFEDRLDAEDQDRPFALGGGALEPGKGRIALTQRGKADRDFRGHDEPVGRLLLHVADRGQRIGATSA